MKGTQSPRPPDAASADGEAKENSLLDNPWMKLLCGRRGFDDRKHFEVFLKRNHRIKREVFSEINKLSDDEILRRTDELLATHETEENDWFGFTNVGVYNPGFEGSLTLRELFLYTMAGASGLSHLLLTELNFYTSPDAIDRRLQQGGESQTRAGIRKHYLVIKGMEILAKNPEAVLIQDKDIDALVAYCKRNSFLALDVKSPLALAGLLIPSDTLPKQESLRNLLALIDKLEKESPKWAQALSVQEAKVKVIRQALADSDGEIIGQRREERSCL